MALLALQRMLACSSTAVGAQEVVYRRACSLFPCSGMDHGGGGCHLSCISTAGGEGELGSDMDLGGDGDGEGLFSQLWDAFGNND